MTQDVTGLNMPDQDFEGLRDLMEGRLDELTVAARRVREHLTHCEHSDQQSIDGFDEILKALGIFDRI